MNELQTATGLPSPKWWLAEPEQATKQVMSVLSFLHSRQISRLKNIAMRAKQYSNLAFGGGGVWSSSMQRVLYQETAPVSDTRLTFNGIQSCVDSLQAKIAASEPTPDFLTDDGDFRMQHLAEQLDTFCGGLWYENQVPRRSIQVFKDACIWGDGWVKVTPIFDRCVHERVTTNQIWVDELEASLNSGPRQLHHVYEIDREEAKARWPDKADLLENAGRLRIGIYFTDPSCADPITIMDSWHLPSGPKSTDGKHLNSCTEGPLTELEDHNRDHYPFARMEYSRRSFGYWPQGLAEQLVGMQNEVNRILWSIQKSLMMGGTYKVWAPNGGKLVVAHIDDRIGAVLKSDVKPEYLTPQLVPPELYTQLESVIKKMYDQSGISMLSATSQKPADLSSGKALRTFEDINTARFQVVGKAYEQFHVQLARLSIECVQDIGGSYRVKSPKRNSLNVIDFAKIGLTDGDDYDIQCFPISSLPNDPAGRLAQVQEMMQGNLVDPEEGRDLLGFPDLQRSDLLHAAPRKLQEKRMDDMINEGIYVVPDKDFEDVVIGRKLAMEYLNRGMTQSLPEDRLQLLRNYIQAIDAQVNPPLPPGMPPVGPQPGGGGPTPLGRPLPPPPSTLQPFAPQGP